MEKTREWWRRPRTADSQAIDKLADKPAPEFRSDNDLLAWRFIAPIAGALTFLSLCLLGIRHVPFVYTPVAIIPAVIAVLFFRWRTMRDRKAGKRFSLYDEDDI